MKVNIPYMDPMGYRGKVGGGNSNISYFHPYLGKILILSNNFSNGFKSPTSCG